MGRVASCPRRRRRPRRGDRRARRLPAGPREQVPRRALARAALRCARALPRRRPPPPPPPPPPPRSPLLSRQAPSPKSSKRSSPSARRKTSSTSRCWSTRRRRASTPPPCGAAAAGRWGCEGSLDAAGRLGSGASSAPPPTVSPTFRRALAASASQYRQRFVAFFRQLTAHEALELAFLSFRLDFNGYYAVYERDEADAAAAAEAAALAADVAAMAAPGGRACVSISIYSKHERTSGALHSRSHRNSRAGSVLSALRRLATVVACCSSGDARDVHRRMEPGSKPHVALILLDDWSWEWWPRASHAVARRALPNIASVFVDDGLALGDTQRAGHGCAASRKALLTRCLLRPCSLLVRARLSTVADRLRRAA